MPTRRPIANTDRSAVVRVHDLRAGQLTEHSDGRYAFAYDAHYLGAPISLTMPVRTEPYVFERFPPFFDGLLPEGHRLEALLRKTHLDRDDLFGQLLVVGSHTVGAVTVIPVEKDYLP